MNTPDFTFRSLAIALFVVCAGFGIAAFWFVVDLAGRLQISEYAALCMISVAWVVLFLVWLVSFVLSLSLLEKTGLRRGSFPVSLNAAARRPLRLRNQTSMSVFAESVGFAPETSHWRAPIRPAKTCHLLPSRYPN
jgi:hypothetical protein